MNVYLGIKFHKDCSNRLLIESISKVLTSLGCQCTCVTRDVEEWGAKHFSPQELMKRTFEIIDLCDICLIDLSEKGVGLGIEAGYAFAQGKPIYTIAKTGSDISTTLAGISTAVYHYQGMDDLTLFLARFIK